MEPHFDSLPMELKLDIFCRVAQFSYTDLYNVKLCCKNFLAIAQEDAIFHHICLDSFPPIQWAQTYRVGEFLDKCIQMKNPDALFDKAVIEYFDGNGDPDEAIQTLEEASNFGHHVAAYTLGLVMILVGDERKTMGIKLLADMKRAWKGKLLIEHCRQRLRQYLSWLWGRNRWAWNRLPCCTVHRRYKYIGWNLHDGYYACDECSCDHEVDHVLDRFPYANLDG